VAEPDSRKRLVATSGGLVALAIWSTTVGIVRDVAESLGVVTGPMLAMLAGGVVALAVSWARGVGPVSMLRLPRRYLLGCGGMFVAYEVCFLTAVYLRVRPGVGLIVGCVLVTAGALICRFSIVEGDGKTR